MKIALINPGPKISLYSNKVSLLNRLLKTPLITLYYLAALTPQSHEIILVDEGYYGDSIDFDLDLDLVGITVLTHVARRAYEIADEFRKRGIAVVLGGVHPTAMPQEAIIHADTVVLGEAEEIWQQLIEDFQEGILKRFYHRNSFHNLKNLPIPRWDLNKGLKFADVTRVQISRGCPFGCEFCSVPIICGKEYRFRPIEDVLLEISSVGSKFLAFMDDNIVGNPKYAIEFFENMIPYKKQWVGSAAVTVVDNERILQLLKKCGCVGLNIGFESITQENLRNVGKNQNQVQKYKDIIKKLHDHGITVFGSFMFGFDHDDKGIFERTLEFCLKNSIDIVGSSILTPYPGTPIYQRLKQEGRMLEKDWWLGYNYFINIDSDSFIPNVLFQPKLMSPEELLNGFLFMWKESYKLNSIADRLSGAGQRGWFQLIFSMFANLIIKDYYSPYFNFERAIRFKK